MSSKEGFIKLTPIRWDKARGYGYGLLSSLLPTLNIATSCVVLTCVEIFLSGNDVLFFLTTLFEMSETLLFLPSKTYKAPNHNNALTYNSHMSSTIVHYYSIGV